MFHSASACLGFQVFRACFVCNQCCRPSPSKQQNQAANHSRHLLMPPQTDANRRNPRDERVWDNNKGADYHTAVEAPEDAESLVEQVESPCFLPASTLYVCSPKLTKPRGFVSSPVPAPVANTVPCECPRVSPISERCARHKHCRIAETKTEPIIGARRSSRQCGASPRRPTPRPRSARRLGRVRLVFSGC